MVAENTTSGKVTCFGDTSIVLNGKITEANNIDVEGCSISVDVSAPVEKSGADVTADPVISIGVRTAVSGDDTVGSPIENDDSVVVSVIVVEVVGEKPRCPFTEVKHPDGSKLTAVDTKNIGF